MFKFKVITFAENVSLKNILEPPKLCCSDTNTQTSQMALATFTVCCEIQLEREP